MSQVALDMINRLNFQYKVLTGEDAYMYAYQPEEHGQTRFVFSTCATTLFGTGDALAHMQMVLEKARNGWTHDEIAHGKNRS